MTEPLMQDPTASEVYKLLIQDLTHLFYLRHTYAVLFRPAFAERFAAVAPAFFADCERLHFEVIALSISRLHDPATSGRNRENCTLAQLLRLVALDNASLPPSINREVEDLRATNPFREYRHKRFGHRDLRFARERDTIEVNIAELDTHLVRVDKVLKAIATAIGEDHYLVTFVKPSGALEFVSVVTKVESLAEKREHQ